MSVFLRIMERVNALTANKSTDESKNDLLIQMGEGLWDQFTSSEGMSLYPDIWKDGPQPCDVRLRGVSLVPNHNINCQMFVVTVNGHAREIEYMYPEENDSPKEKEPGLNAYPGATAYVRDTEGGVMPRYSGKAEATASGKAW
jgi:hypothetical protein